MKPTIATVIQAAPIALRRDQASQALGISVSLFESLVRQGRMPKPRLLGDKSVGWLYVELQRCVEALPVSNLPPGPSARRSPASSGAEFNAEREPSVPTPHRGG
jgi:predicted DNA-binding transcriptional regulator AlpA